jgi:hypothetical protein
MPPSRLESEGDPMSSAREPERPLRRLSVDDAWIVEWAGEGVRQIERFLDLHAAFDRYLDERGGPLADVCDDEPRIADS